MRLLTRATGQLSVCYHSQWKLSPFGMAVMQSSSCGLWQTNQRAIDAYKHINGFNGIRSCVLKGRRIVWSHFNDSLSVCVFHLRMNGNKSFHFIQSISLYVYKGEYEHFGESNVDYKLMAIYWNFNSILIFQQNCTCGGDSDSWLSSLLE